MSYSKKFSPEKYEGIAGILEKIQGMSPGARVTVSGVEAAALVEIRYLIYDFLHQMGVKKLYKIRSLENALLIQRLGFKDEPKVLVEEEHSPKLEALIDAWETPNVNPELMLKVWVDTGELTREEGDALWEKVKRIMS